MPKHHYVEDQETQSEADATVSFNATIQPPTECTKPSTPRTQPRCVPVPTDPLVDILPTVLLGVGIAYVVGVATGAWIFSPLE